MRQNVLILAALVAVSAAGCYAPGRNNLNSTRVANRRMDATKRNAGRHLNYMVDNAMLHDMAIVDEHFVPHTSELNGTGAARLERMAILLNTYGGTVRYDARTSDQKIVAERMAHVREYLEVSGCDMSRVKVERMLSGGRGHRAVQAIEFDDRGPVPPPPSSMTTNLLSPSGN